MAELPEGLLDDVKSYLNITWQDDATDRKVTGYINRGMKRLQDIAGASLDFTVEDQPQALLLDYCRYANSQALEVFEKNFEAELLDLNLKTQAPVIDSLILITAPESVSGAVVLFASPVPQEDGRYVYKIGTELTTPACIAVCAPPDFTLWNGVDSIPAVSGQEILIVEVDDEYEAVRAGKVTV